MRFQDRGRRGQLQRRRWPPVRGLVGVTVPVELERERDGNTRAVEVNKPPRFRVGVLSYTRIITRFIRVQKKRADWGLFSRYAL